MDHRHNPAGGPAPIRLAPGDYSWSSPPSSSSSSPARTSRFPMQEEVNVQKEVKVEKESISIIFSALPSSIQSRLPPLPSIRKSISLPRSGPLLFSPFPASTAASKLADGTLPGPGLDNLTVANPEPGVPVHQATGSGVDWKCGCQGLALIATARQESQQPRGGGHNAAFERAAYLDGVSYLLMGLPADLDAGEAAALSRAGRPSRAVAAAGRPPPSSSAVRVAVQRLVARAVVALFVLWPYVLLLARRAAECERRHHVAEQLAAGAAELAGAAVRGGRTASLALCALGDGWAGRRVAEALARTVRDVAGGVCEGLEEGLVKVGLER